MLQSFSYAGNAADKIQKSKDQYLDQDVHCQYKIIINCVTTCQFVYMSTNQMNAQYTCNII